MEKSLIPAFALLIMGCMEVPQTDLQELKAMQVVWQSAYDAND